MGLTVHYELRLPPTTTDDAVDATLSALHAFALTLPFARVTPLCTPPADSGWLATWATLISRPFEDDEPALTGDTDSARGFLVHPGNGCETAVFGFMRRADAAGVHREWFWYSFCKTQYASVISEAHFLACHKSLTALLDHAATLGVDVVVRDDSGYWETREDETLLAGVRNMNRIVAAFAGKLSDALAPAHTVESAIFEHPTFEHLEMGQ